MSKLWPGRVLVLIAVALGISGMPARPQDAVWNLRTPEWQAAWQAIPGPGDPDLDLIRIASQLVAYSGSFFPVAPLAPGIDAGLQSGQVPVELAWFEAPPGILAFGVANGWAHLVLRHDTLAQAGSAQDAAAWSVGVRYARDDAAAGDAWAARFLAEFGHPVEPLLARLCGNGEGARAEAVARSYGEVVGWQAPVPCAPAPAAVEAPAPVLDCDQGLDACRAGAQARSLACSDACTAGQCVLSCSSGSQEQCSSCNASCSRACTSAAAAAWDACDEALEACRADD